jgi:hypothetical protein
MHEMRKALSAIIAAPAALPPSEICDLSRTSNKRDRLLACDQVAIYPPSTL